MHLAAHGGVFFCFRVFWYVVLFGAFGLSLVIFEDFAVLFSVVAAPAFLYVLDIVVGPGIHITFARCTYSYNLHVRHFPFRFLGGPTERPYMPEAPTSLAM